MSPKLYRKAYEGKEFMDATIEDLQIYGNAILTDNTKTRAYAAMVEEELQNSIPF